MVAHLVLLLVLASPVSGDPINAAIGDASWIVATGTSPDARAGETDRIVTHLKFVHATLARARVPQLSASQQRRRSDALATLERYIERREFPRRTGDGYAGRRPRFIDDRGVHCAVGYLIAASDPELAHAINAAHEYDYVPDIVEPRLLAWAAENGFTLDELAMIQPTYGGSMPPTPESIERKLETSRELLALACQRTSNVQTTLELQVTGDRRGRVKATTKATDPVARCVAKRASQLASASDDDFLTEPQSFVFDMTLELDSPLMILERRVAGSDLDTYCTPRPGAIPDRATLEIQTTKEGLIASVTTTPSNSEIDRCIEERARAWLDAFARIPGLAAKRDITLVSRLATDKFRHQLQMGARSIAMACYEGKQPTVTIELTVSAKRDDPTFTIALATRDKKLVACMREKLPPYLTDLFSVSRRTGPSTSESYFRIDTDLRVTVPIILTAPRPAPPAKSGLSPSLVRAG
jgi:hypothetical protein